MIKIGHKYRIDNVILKRYIDAYIWPDFVSDIENLQYVTIIAYGGKNYYGRYSEKMSFNMYRIEESFFSLPEACFKPLRLDKLKRILS